MPYNFKQQPSVPVSWKVAVKWITNLKLKREMKGPKLKNFLTMNVVKSEEVLMVTFTKQEEKMGTYNLLIQVNLFEKQIII